MLRQIFLITLIVFLTNCRSSNTIEPTVNLINEIDTVCDKEYIKCELNEEWFVPNKCEKQWEECSDKLEEIKGIY